MQSLASTNNVEMAALGIFASVEATLVF